MRRPLPSPDFVRLNLIGQSPVFLQVLALITRTASCDVTVLIEGETGTGKELAARAIHYLGGRRDFPFIPVNCGAIPDTLVENELFGHTRGAFTGAGDANPGLIAEAEGGTLFLDEVETLSPRAQVVLLRFLQDGSYRSLGGRRLSRGSVRIVAASNADLAALAERGAFRQDLLYRLKVMSIDMPALRARGSDALLLVEHFLRRLSTQYAHGVRVLDPSFVEYVQRHRWPGNIRELENLLHRQYLLSDGAFVTLPDNLRPQEAEAVGAVTDARHEPLPHKPSFALGFNTARARALESFERSFVEWALSQTRGNVSLAARQAGKERRSFGRLLKKHGIRRSNFISS
jgi:two-component system response regulator GlrR